MSRGSLLDILLDIINKLEGLISLIKWLIVFIFPYSGVILILGEKIREEYFYYFVLVVEIFILVLTIYIYQQRNKLKTIQNKLNEAMTNKSDPAIIATYHVEKNTNGSYKCTIIVNLKKELLRERYGGQVNNSDLSLTKAFIITDFKPTDPSGIALMDDSDNKYFTYKLDADSDAIIETCMFSFTVTNPSPLSIFLKILHHPTNEIYGLNISL